MTSSETVQALIAAIEANDFAKAATYVTPDFTFGGAVPQPLNAQAWLGFHQALNQACPDMRFNLRVVEDQGALVKATVQLSGTQTGTLNAPALGINNFAPTGKHFQLPQEPVDFDVHDGKVAAIRVAAVPGGGVAGLLGQLGIQMPH